MNSAARIPITHVPFTQADYARMGRLRARLHQQVVHPEMFSPAELNRLCFQRWRFRTLSYNDQREHAPLLVSQITAYPRQGD